MALTNCAKCGHRVSDKAERCPGCKTTEYLSSELSGADTQAKLFRKPQRPPATLVKSRPGAHSAPASPSDYDALHQQRGAPSDQAVPTNVRQKGGGGWDPFDDQELPRTISTGERSGGPEVVRPAASSRDRFTVRGIVRDFKEHQNTIHAGEEVIQSITWDFMIDRLDSNDNYVRPMIAVQMRQENEPFDGFIRDGHMVGLFDHATPGTLVQVDRVFNLTTGSMVQAASSRVRNYIKKASLACFFVGFLLFAGAILFDPASKQSPSMPSMPLLIGAALAFPSAAIFKFSDVLLR